MSESTTFPVAELSDVEVAFPASVREIMPAYEDIPDEFKNLNNRDNKWLQFQADWFFGGLQNVQVTVRDGIDETKAWRHLSAIQRSFEPKHEHKVAAVAYLASQWFEDVKYEPVA